MKYAYIIGGALLIAVVAYLIATNMKKKAITEDTGNGTTGTGTGTGSGTGGSTTGTTGTGTGADAGASATSIPLAGV